ncbi:MAG: ral secretion pathway protein [Candidatus Saccharibacteria bacterium]|nr:ral secretion pathway protein [Candidatus Saccharibacteria bacterium]
MNKQGGRGFTIVELLIVIVVISILAVIVIVAYNGVVNKAYMSRSQSELASIGKAIQTFNVINSRYPADVSRGIPSEVSQYINGASNSWPTAPWPNSEYDYDYFIGSDGNEVSQISIRFCPAGGPLSACKFPNEPWAANFGIDSSVYWCVTGKCRAHPNQVDSYPGRCLNCVIP